MSETAAAYTSSSLPRLSEQQFARLHLPITGISVAISIIAILGLSGILPTQESAYILGGVTLGGSAIALLIHMKIFHHNIDGFESPTTSAKVFLAVEMITMMALGILGMTGTLSSHMVGLGLLATSAFAFSINIINQNMNHDLKKSLHYFIPIALTIINILGVTGVIGGGDASLILGMTNGAGILLFALVDYAHNEDLPLYIKVMRAFLPVMAIAFGALGIAGVSPMTIGSVGVSTISSVYVTTHFINTVLVNCKKEETN